MAGATLAWFLLVPRFQLESHELIANPGFDDGTRDWLVRPAQSTTQSDEILMGEGSTLTSVRQWMGHPGADHVLVRVRFSVFAEAGAQGTARADIYLRAEDTGKPEWIAPVFARTSTTGSQIESTIIRLPRSGDVQFEAEIIGPGVTMLLDEVSVRGATQAPWDGPGTLVLALCWGLLAAIIIAQLTRHGDWLVVGAGALLLGLLVLLPAPVKLAIRSVIGDGGPVSWDHLLPMFLTGIVIAMSTSWRMATVALVTLAIVLEVLQLFVEHREPLVADAVANAVGAVAGVAATAAYRHIAASR